MGVAVGISLISDNPCRFRDKCTSGLLPAILNFGSRRTSNTVGNVTVESGMVENVNYASLTEKLPRFIESTIMGQK